MSIKFIISNLILMFGLLYQTNIEILYQKSNLKLDIEYYKGLQYIPISQLSRIFILNKDIIIHENSLQYKDEELIFSEFSFFIVYKSNSQMRVAQMINQCLKINSELCIPILPFFKAMNSLNLINTQILNDKMIDIIEYSIFETDKKIKISENKFEDHNDKQKVIFESDSSSSKKKRNKNKNVINIFEFNKDEKIQRGKYSIPRSIKK